jgi:hypothetical protein
MLSPNAKQWLKDIVDFHEENDEDIDVATGLDVTVEAAALARAEVVAFVAEITK